MPDITMCINLKCPHNTSCYRFLAKPAERQSYSDFQTNPIYSTQDNCQYYYPIQSLPEDIPLNKPEQAKALLDKTFQDSILKW